MYVRCAIANARISYNSSINCKNVNKGMHWVNEALKQTNVPEYVIHNEISIKFEKNIINNKTLKALASNGYQPPGLSFFALHNGKF